jgi:hypothetical protein
MGILCRTAIIAPPLCDKRWTDWAGMDIVHIYAQTPVFIYNIDVGEEKWL